MLVLNYGEFCERIHVIQLQRLFKINKCLITRIYLKEIPGWSLVFQGKEDESFIVCLFVETMVILSKDKSKATGIIQVSRQGYDTKVIQDGTPEEQKM